MPADASLEVRIRHRIGTLSLDVEFRTSALWCVLFGSSGSGKSTILRAIAGVLRPDEGRIVIGGQVVFDAAQKIWVPSHLRGMRWAPQRAMLAEWKTVRGNLALGLGGKVDVAGVARSFGLETMLDRRPEELSGGQRQLVGVVRAAAELDGRTLLLDEPFTGLDAAIRDRLIGDLRRWIGSSPVLSVTHDVGEAFLLGAEVVRVADGRVVAQGPVGEVLAEERRRLREVLG